MEALVARTTSSMVWTPVHGWLSHPDKRPEPPTRRQARRGDEDTQSEYSTQNLCWVDVTTGRDAPSVLKDRGQRRWEERCMMHGSQNAFGHRATLPSTTGRQTPMFGNWLKDYHLVCRADDDMFII
jgi:hypothetical protein